MDVKNESKKHLVEHAGIMTAMKEMAADISVNFAKVESNFKIMRVKGDAESEVRGIQYEEILKEQKITNGRITVQEKTTEVIRIMVENKGYTFIFLYGLFNILQHLSISNITRWINLII